MRFDGCGFSNFMTSHRLGSRFIDCISSQSPRACRFGRVAPYQVGIFRLCLPNLGPAHGASHTWPSWADNNRGLRYGLKGGAVYAFNPIFRRRDSRFLRRPAPLGRPLCALQITECMLVRCLNTSPERGYSL